MNYQLGQLHISALVVLFFLLALTSQLHSQSFDCTARLNETETEICNDDELSALDILVSKAYREAPDIAGWMTTDELKITQREWLLNRNACGDKITCIRDQYVRRLKNLADTVLDLSLVQSGPTYSYEGEPDNGQCGAGETLSDWGQCVLWHKGGASFNGVSAGGDMAYAFFSIGANMHTCDMRGLAIRTQTGWRGRYGECEVSMSLLPQGLEIKTNGLCKDYCGFRAVIDHTFEY